MPSAWIAAKLVPLLAQSEPVGLGGRGLQRTWKLASGVPSAFSLRTSKPAKTILPSGWSTANCPLPMRDTTPAWPNVASSAPFALRRATTIVDLGAAPVESNPARSSFPSGVTRRLRGS